MTKSITIIVLVIALIAAITFGVIQRTESRKQEALAVANAQEALIQRDAAETARVEAEQQRRMAIQNAMEAERQRQVADEALRDCRKKR